MPTLRNPVFLPALAGAGLLWLCYFPAACGWLAWVALTPWLFLVRSPARPARLYFAAWVGALAFYAPALQWLRVADPRMYATWAILSVYCACYVSLGLFLVRLLDRRTCLPLTLSFPVVWTALEFFRASFIGLFASRLIGSHQHDWPGGFGWYCVGHTQHDFLELLQLADLAGVYGVTFLVCAANALLFEVIATRRWFRAHFAPDAPAPRRLALLGQAALVAGLLLGALAYGSWRLSEDSQTPGPRLALLQGNVDQRLRILGTAEGEASLEARKHIDGHYGALVRLAGRGHPDLVVWPETSLTQHWEEYPPGVPDRDSQRQACDLAAEAGSPVLLGVNSYVVDSDRKLRAYNSAVLVDAVGRRQGRYDKIHRVPFGEYIPVRSLMPWLNSLAPYDFDYSVHPGEAFTRFHLGRERRYTFGVVICYEDTVPDMALPYGGGGPAPADFLLNISNDGWFDGTSEHDQHLALCRFRAVECRRSVARAVNMGISAVIDSNGRVLRPRGIDAPGVPDGMHLWEVPAGGGPELPVSGWGEFKKVAGVLFATVPVDHRSSLYARWGDWLPALCWLLLGGWGVVALLGRPRSVPGLAAAVR